MIRSISTFLSAIVSSQRHERPQLIRWQIFQRLDDYVGRIRSAHPEIDDQSPRQKASTAAQYLIENNLVAILKDREYYNIEHNFLGRALFTQERNSLPIITVIIYCYVVRQLGLSADPCGFPLHVYAIVYPPPGIDLEGDPLPPAIEPPALYMDPFRTSDPVPVSSLHEQLSFIARRLTPDERATFLSASNPCEIVVRCARNILNCLHQITDPPATRPIDTDAAKYAAFWALVFFPTSSIHPGQHLISLMRLFAESFPHDVSIMEKHIGPVVEGLGPQHGEMCRSLRMVDMEGFAAVKQRVGNPEAEDVKFRVGQVFRHKRYGYTAVVTGWDGRCDAGEEWIQQMGVDRLAGGRTQAFYHAL
jgi:F-box protein 21